MALMLGDELTNRELEPELLERYRAGELGAFEGIYRRCSEALLLYAHSLTGDREWADEIVQEAFVRFLRFDARRLKDSVRPLLYAIVRNLFRDERRKRSVRLKGYPLLVDRRPDAPPPGCDAEALSRALDELPEEQREVVILKVYGDLTFDQIAEMGDVAPGTVRSRYRYAIEKLAHLLEEKP